MRAHKPISKIILASNMRPINVTLDSLTWEYAKEKTNFSAWVRDQLRSERNRTEKREKRCTYCLGLFPVESFYGHKCGEEE